MSSFPLNCPSCGAPLSESMAREPVTAEVASGPALVESGSESEIEFGSASAIFIARHPSEPDPILGVFSPESRAALSPTERASGRFGNGAPEPAGKLDSDTQAAVALACLDLRTSARPTTPKPQSDSVGDGSVEEYVEEGGPPRWMLPVLGSYASAVTLALLWILVGHRSLVAPARPIPDEPVAEELADPGRRASATRRVAAIEPIPPANVVGLGKPLRLDDLELTPIRVDVRKARISRRELSGGVDVKSGEESLVLKVRLANRSSDLVFAPLDESFLRDGDREVADSFIQGPAGERYSMYPLAVHSEWSIVGQEFRELKPGEVYETDIVAAAKFPRCSDELTWRIRLRVGDDQTAVVGVRFRDPRK